MTRISKAIAVAIAAGGLAVTSLAFAQDDSNAKQPKAQQNMQEMMNGMQGGDTGMMPMMNMMTQMNKMMETCNTMMQAMMQNTGKPAPKGNQPNKG